MSGHKESFDPQKVDAYLSDISEGVQSLANTLERVRIATSIYIMVHLSNNSYTINLQESQKVAEVKSKNFPLRTHANGPLMQ